MRCAKHDEETSVSCGRCGVPVCPKCMVHTDVGVRCANCAPDRGRPLTSMSKGSVIVGGAIALILVIGGLGYASDLLGASGSNEYYDEYDYDPDDWYDVNTTVEELVDPWEPDRDGPQPRAGQRYVAIEVIVENDAGSEFEYYLEDTDFKLTDADGFAYGATASGAGPELPFIELAPGEKARGWVTFEVPEDAEIASISDYFGRLDLPN